MSAHLHPHNGVGDFIETLEDVRSAMRSAMNEGRVIIGMGVEDCLRKEGVCCPCPRLVGPHGV
eukprot:8494196-Lingulodinium_polyedra.AAC.1